jgi:glycosyltransferase involved in cell wall biosynthesis
MRIAVLAHNLRVAGALSVGLNVVTALRRVGDAHEYLLFLPSGVGYEPLEKPTRSQCHYLIRRHGAVSHWLFENFRIPARVRAFAPDVVWGLGNFGLSRPGAPQAFLFHKAHFVYEPKYRRGESRRARLLNAALRRRLARSLPATQLVFCQTEAARARFREAFRYRGRIALMPNAVSEHTLRGDPGRRPPAFAALAGKFILFCLTRYYTQKNLEALLDVFARYPDDLRDVAVVFTVGADQHPGAPRFLARLARSPARDRLVNVGPVAQSALAGCFLASDALILPTILESFSGTYLEAMQYERPILTSDLDFAHAVCGPAARYFDPFDPASIRDAIVELRDSPALRARLVQAGIARRQAWVRGWDDIVAEALVELEALVRAPAERVVSRAAGVPRAGS